MTSKAAKAEKAKQELQFQNLLSSFLNVDENTFSMITNIQAGEKLETILEIEKQKINLTIHCSKTGQPVANFPIEMFCNICETHGIERAKVILESHKIAKIHPNWLFTDDKSLEKLSQHDPYGYFVFAASRILIPVQDSLLRDADLAYSQKKQFMTIWREEREHCWKNIQATPLNQIIEANELMRKFLSVFRTNKVAHIIPFKCSEIPPGYLGKQKSILNWIEELRAAFAAILRYEIRKRRIHSALTYDDVVALKDKYEGHSNFRRQKAKYSETELIMQELGDFIIPAEHVKTKSTFVATQATITKTEKTQIATHESKHFKLKWAGKK